MSDAHFTASSSDTGTTRSVFVRWERWRQAYNLALGSLVFFLAATGGGSDSDWRRFAGQCVLGALVANICYFAGPFAEAYLQWVGFRHRATAPLLFVGGVVLASGLAAITITSSLIPF